MLSLIYLSIFSFCSSSLLLCPHVDHKQPIFIISKL